MPKTKKTNKKTANINRNFGAGYAKFQGTNPWRIVDMSGEIGVTISEHRTALEAIKVLGESEGKGYQLRNLNGR